MAKKESEVWKKCDDIGSASCLSKWLSERAVVKAKRDAANKVKMAGLITAIDAGSVCVKRGGGRNVTLDSDKNAFLSGLFKFED